MDYTVLITTPITGRQEIGCATQTDVENTIVNFIRHNIEQEYIIEVVLNTN